MPDLNFHNPYHFVPVDPVRNPGDDLSVAEFRAGKVGHVTHDRFVPGTYSGRLICRLEAVDPLVVGGEQSHPAGKLGEVKPFTVNGLPAIPASSLRGLISSLAEAASNSAMRVLDNKAFSYRMPMDKSLPAIGMIVLEKNDAGEVTRRTVRPLALPHMRWSEGRSPRGRLEAGYATIFGRHLAKPTPYFLKVYVDGYGPVGPRNDTIQVNANSFLARECPRSYSADHHERVATHEPVFWYMKLPGSCWLSGQDLVVQRPRTTARKDYLLGQEPDATTREPISERVYLELPPAKREGYIRGILRVLGIEGRETEIPTGFKNGVVLGKKHEIFIPYPPEAETNWDTIEIPVEVWGTFHALADERTDSTRRSDRTSEQLWLPFHLQGSERNDDRRKDGPYLRLRDGDLVFFSANEEGQIAEIAISSIWRRYAGHCHDYFSQVSPELLPFHGDRESITIAEQLFGFVEARHRDEPHPAPAAPSLALAGRVRFSTASLVQKAPQPGTQNAPPSFYDDESPEKPGVTLKILSSPKTPCPSLYFTHADGTEDYIAKIDLDGNQHRPQGRKMYLHRDPRGRAAKSRPWKTGFPEKHQDQKNRVRPIKAGSKFYFHIDFDNLSRRELALLCYSLAPTDTFHHKLGMGKSLGLGTVKIEPVGLFFIDRSRRYRPDQLFEPRYHSARLDDRWCQQPVLGEWIGRYRPEFDAAIRPAIRALAGFPSFDEARDEFRGAMDRRIRTAIERIGSLDVAHEVQYPRRRNQHDPEGELYRWFTANDDRHQQNRQWLKPIDPDQDGLPTLEPN